MKYVLSADKYADALRGGKFLGLKCNQCGGYTVPPQKVCFECHSEDMEVVELSRNGEVRSFTVIYTPAEGFQPPYIVGLIELEEGPWVTANIIDYAPEKATMEELMGRKGRIDYQEVPADMFSGGPRIALAFKVAD
ncbi:MAG: Zn-ribbon domain-containing OB-fold protein [Chloroflexota bacterium]